MIIEKKKLEDDESSEEEGVQKSVIKDKSRWNFNFYYLLRDML